MAAAIFNFDVTNQFKQEIFFMAKCCYIQKWKSVTPLCFKWSYSQYQRTFMVAAMMDFDVATNILKEPFLSQDATIPKKGS